MDRMLITPAATAPDAASAVAAASVSPEEAAELGREVLDECRSELMLAFRFLDAALWHAPFEPDDRLYALDTDGTRVCFSPEALLARYLESPAEVVRDYLHLLLHCIFRHPFDTAHPDSDAWWIACDIVVESIAMEMCAKRWPSPADERRRAELASIVKAAGSVNPYKLYRLIQKAFEAPDPEHPNRQAIDCVLRWRTLFFRDSHFLWFREDSGDGEGESAPRPQPRDDADSDSDPSSTEMSAGSAEDEAAGGGDEPDADADPDEAEDADAEETEEAEEATDEEEEDVGPDDEEDDGFDPREDARDAEEAERQWRDIAEHLEMDLASFGQLIGKDAGSLSVMLALANRKPVDYADFLRRFATVSEELKINDDEFDYVFYTYGLKLYGDMPLIEPLEYQETNRVREFVIAIDTSGSTQGELVRTFVTRTCEILRETEQFGSKVNIHIIQCDARIQEDAKIESVRDLERYRDSFRVRGGGGTDFRPVFDYVDQLIERGEFEDLRGLIYFTDGEGTYPKKMPAYDTAFVFVDDDPRSRVVPPWAMRVVLDSDSIREL